MSPTTFSAIALGLVIGSIKYYIVVVYVLHEEGKYVLKWCY